MQLFSLILIPLDVWILVAIATSRQNQILENTQV